MNQQKRLLAIMEQLKKEKSLTLQNIMLLTGSSRDTARRDTIKLADNNLIVRNYGGISLADSFSKLDGYLDRTNQLTQIKKKIAKEASLLVAEEQIIYFDVSTTVALLPQFLANKKTLHAVTNSIDIADRFLKHTEIATTILGGSLNRKTRAVTGGYPLWELSKYQFDVAFLSCAGVDEKGIYFAHEEDIAMKNKIRDQSKKVVIMCDHSKVGLTHNFLVYPFEELDYFVTDKKLPEELTRKIGMDKIIYLKGSSYD